MSNTETTREQVKVVSKEKPKAKEEPVKDEVKPKVMMILFW